MKTDLSWEPYPDSPKHFHESAVPTHIPALIIKYVASTLCWKQIIVLIVLITKLTEWTATQITYRPIIEGNVGRGFSIYRGRSLIIITGESDNSVSIAHFGFDL